MTTYYLRFGGQTRGSPRQLRSAPNLEGSDRDLEAKGVDGRVDLQRFEDPDLAATISAVHPKGVPVGKAPSIFDAA